MVCPVCDGCGVLLGDPCPLCGGDEEEDIDEVEEGGSRNGNPLVDDDGCLRQRSPADVDAEDVAALIEQALATSEGALRRLRRRLNGDPSLQYRVTESQQVVRISVEVWQFFERLFRDGAGDNRERPFIVVMDERRRRAVAAVLGEVGSQDCCEHTPGSIARAHAEAQALGLGDAALLAFGHTHPVFEDDVCGPYGSTMGCMQDFQRVVPRAFGGFPSSIFGTKDEWLHLRAEAAASSCASAREAADAVLRERLYKRHGGDYCASLVRQKLLCDPLQIQRCSEFEWILSPRLRQIGCFQPKPQGNIVYFKWVVEA